MADPDDSLDLIARQIRHRVIRISHEANPIIRVDLFHNKLARATEWGLTHSFNSRTEGDALAGKIRGIVGAGGADVVIDTTGNALASSPLMLEIL